MSKQLEVLVERATRKGFARVNGRQWNYGSFGPLREKYSIKVEGDIITLKHWGTVTLVIDTVKKTVIDVYGISNSDRDSVNFILDEFDIPYHVHFYPSRDEFEMHCNEKDSVQVVI